MSQSPTQGRHLIRHYLKWLFTITTFFFINCIDNYNKENCDCVLLYQQAAAINFDVSAKLSIWQVSLGEKCGVHFVLPLLDISGKKINKGSKLAARRVMSRLLCDV